VSPEDIVATNPNIPGGGEPAPGQLLNIIAKIDNEPTKAASLKFPPAEVTVTGPAVTLLKAEVHQTSQADSTVIGHIPKGSQVELLGKVLGWVYRVHYGEMIGFVPTAILKIGAVLPKANPHDNKVANEALKYLGTPYLWGGNNLRSGIDCSHFVAQVYVHLGWREPSPPVVVQETIGEMVECKEGPARRGGRLYNLPDPAHFPAASTNLNALEEGDRIIFQHALTDASGSRHTGIYIGSVPDAWRARFGDVHYAFVHAGCSHGVTVGSLLDPYFWKIYKYSLRSAH
jgi:cell wall-associated NlpC family hydrolase